MEEEYINIKGVTISPQYYDPQGKSVNARIEIKNKKIKIYLETVELENLLIALKIYLEK
jgi:hypothetical protein